MYTKSKNSLLFVIFIIIILLIIGILIMSVYNTKQSSLEQYKVSLNNVLYDDEYNYVLLDDDAILKKEWDNNFYLYLNKGGKYSLGTETVFYDKSTRQVNIYGKVYQVFSNGDVSETDDKTVISNLDEFQFFKLNDRKYLLIGEKITAPSVSTFDYLIISIDRAGNASLLNHSVNIKTINPLNLFVGEKLFDVANERLIIGEEEIDLKKINGSTNEYVPDSSQNKPSTGGGNNTIGGSGGGSGGSSGSTSNNQNSGSSSSGTVVNNKVYKEIINQIITLSGMIPTNTNKTSLYKNVSLRDISVGSSYLDIFYSIIDPENKYLNVYLAIHKVTEDDRAENINEIAKISANNCDSGYAECVSLDKDSYSYRKKGLTPGSEYVISLNYLESGSSIPVIADVITVVTSTDPTSVRVVEQDGYTYTYNIKLYNEYAFKSAKVVITNCKGTDLSINSVDLDVQSALSSIGATGQISRKVSERLDFVCLELKEVKDANDNLIDVNSYHKIKNYQLDSLN